MEKFYVKAMRALLSISKVIWAWITLLEVITIIFLTFMPNVDGSYYWFCIIMGTVLTIAMRIGIGVFQSYVETLPNDEEAVG